MERMVGSVELTALLWSARLKIWRTVAVSMVLDTSFYDDAGSVKLFCQFDLDLFDSSAQPLEPPIPPNHARKRFPIPSTTN